MVSKAGTRYRMCGALCHMLSPNGQIPSGNVYVVTPLDGNGQIKTLQRRDLLDARRLVPDQLCETPHEEKRGEEDDQHVEDNDDDTLYRVIMLTPLLIPYRGYFEADVTMFGQIFQKMGFLVVEDPTSTAMEDRKRNVPGVIGANILREVKDTIPATASHGNNESCNSWAPLLALCQQLMLTKGDMISRVRVCGCDPILIPARSTKLVRCSVRIAPNGQSYQALVV